MEISSDLFKAFLECPTKCWLRAAGESASGNGYADWMESQNGSYRATEIKQLLSASPTGEAEVSPPPEDLKVAKWRLAANLAANARMNSCLLESEVHAVERVPSEGRGRPAQIIPIRFIFTNKLGEDDKLLLSFDTFVLSEMTERVISFGKIIHGDDRSTLKVKTAAFSGEVRKRIERIAALLASPTPPDLVLNRHCSECEFQNRCRQKAIEMDDLSLLRGMSEKERKNLRSKGIFTVTQLSYTFRPRRRPKRMRDKREKYHHSLKALAIREKKIHIVGSPELKVEGTPIYFDVEGLPDRGFYYLIGARIGSGESAVHHSLWADTAADEGKIWREFLGILATVEKPVLIHYGSFETTFLKSMRQRYGGPPDASVAATAIRGAVNLLSFIFGKIYFPTHSNGLKDIARFLKFSWSDLTSSGTQSIIWRREWEESKILTLKQNLITYNSEDCMALELVATTVGELGQQASKTTMGPGEGDVVNVDSLKNQKTKWGNFSSSIPGFEEINKAAYWDYQRDRVYARSNKILKRIALRKRIPRLSLPSASRAIKCLAMEYCPVCKHQEFKQVQIIRQTLYDIHFSPYGLRREVVDYDLG
jgi:predicted RecB family nuclease